MRFPPPLVLLALLTGAVCVAASERPVAVPAGTRELPDDWAFKPVKRPRTPAPPVTHHAPRITHHASRTTHHPSRNPIDAFIHAVHREHGLAPSREADRHTLLRRVYYDLIGLPPAPDEMRAFLADASPDAYERVVDRLLASPHYGERWARHWMDLVHFAETHGHDQDRIRTNAWPYRDYLIASFNADKSYHRFVEEQVAGDALYPDDPQAAVALGFIAAGPWDESSLRDIREDTLDRQIGRYLDRDDMVTTVMQTFTSTTVQCARCHDHKFDPISQRDYYALQAVFAGVDRANRVYDADAAVHSRRQELLSNLKRAERGDREWLLAANRQGEVAEWERALAGQKVEWTLVEPQTFVSVGGATLTRQADGSMLAAGPRPERDTYTITARAPLPGITAVRLEVLADESLPKSGPGRHDNGNLHLSEFELLLFEPGATQPRPVPLVRPTADFNQAGWTIEQALDRNDKTAWGIHPQVGEPHQAVFELKEPLELPDGAVFSFVLKQLHGESHLIGRPRLSVTAATPPAMAGVLPGEIALIRSIPPPQRGDDQRIALAVFYLEQKLSRELAALPKPSLIYAAASDFEPDGGLKPAGGPRPVHLLRRGDINNPVEAASPGALTCVSRLPARFELSDPSDEGARRAALARWLTHPDNPLTWRSIVNRVWHHHFGRGLVEMPNDFGKMGGAPSHPELLDWLALWFRDEAAGSLKRLNRLIVTSATYRQSSSPLAASASRFVLHADVPSANVSEKAGEPVGGISSHSGSGSRSHRLSGSRSGGSGVSGQAGEPVGENPTHSGSVSDSPTHRLTGSRSLASAATAPQMDADNRYLWRMNRTRLDAEQVRDTILQTAGCLDLRMGGPSDMQFDLQPGIHVTPKVDYTRFDVDSPAARRRSVYRFLFRTLPDPFMDALDCPAGDQLTPVRNASVTVQQALAMWNNAFVAHYAARFAERLESLSKSPESQVTLACELALGRPPTPAELRELSDYAAEHGLANLCRVLLNSNEFMFVN
jgi:hypothetical protein